MSAFGQGLQSPDKPDLLRLAGEIEESLRGMGVPNCERWSRLALTRRVGLQEAVNWCVGPW
jgi:hypothetical protein